MSLIRKIIIKVFSFYAYFLRSKYTEIGDDDITLSLYHDITLALYGNTREISKAIYESMISQKKDTIGIESLTENLRKFKKHKHDLKPKLKKITSKMESMTGLNLRIQPLA